MAGPLATVALVALAASALPVTDEALRPEIDRLTAAVSAARHLPYRGPLAARTVPRDGGHGALAGALAAGVASGALAADETMLKRLGLLPPDADYAALLAARYGTGSVAGYEPEARRLLVPDFVPLEQQRLALTHEIAHAVADQRFGLARFLRVDDEGRWLLPGDALRARLAVVEGDATLTALAVADPRETFLAPHQRAALAEQLTAQLRIGPARWLAESARFTYVDGFLFVARTRARQPWSAVDELWSDPPASTEQVLHPEKYDACEAPIAVDDALLPALPGFGRPKSSDVLGELMIRAWLAVSAPPEVAARAAAGWGGDRVGIYAAAPRPLAENGDQSRDGGAPPDAAGARGTPAPIIWLTVWDDPGEADDFASSAAGAFGAPAVSRRDEAVALAFGLGANDARAALDQTIDGWTRQTRLSRRAGSRPRRAAPTGCPRRDRGAAPP